MFLAIPVVLGARIPLIPERLCGAQPNKETACIYCCVFREVLPLLPSLNHLLFCSCEHLLEPVWVRVSDIAIPRVRAKGGSGGGPRARRELGFGATCALHCAEHPWERQGSAPKAQCRFSRHLCLSPRAPPAPLPADVNCLYYYLLLSGDLV